MLRSLGHLLARRARWVGLAWLVLTVLGFLTSMGYLTGDDLFSRLHTGQPQVPGESADGLDLLETTSTVGPSVHLVVDGVSPRDPAVRAAVSGARPALAGISGATAMVGGHSAIFDEITGQVREDLETGEAIALPVSLLLMVVVFGGLLAAGLPLAGAVASVAGGLATLLGSWNWWAPKPLRRLHGRFGLRHG